MEEDPRVANIFHGHSRAFDDAINTHTRSDKSRSCTGTGGHHRRLKEIQINSSLSQGVAAFEVIEGYRTTLKVLETASTKAEAKTYQECNIYIS